MFSGMFLYCSGVLPLSVCSTADTAKHQSLESNGSPATVANTHHLVVLFRLCAARMVRLCVVSRVLIVAGFVSSGLGLHWRLNGLADRDGRQGWGINGGRGRRGGWSGRGLLRGFGVNWRYHLQEQNHIHLVVTSHQLRMSSTREGYMWNAY